ncbi:MAG: hypothetical protein CMM01_13435 [Rhodopirellula sp.]|nr:hypothetical protein [Rhodopirellula sp.]OUX50769.1 MAG: hypothetical protein CBE43_05900 [Rhodopirellula sp. TMED283]
MQYLCILFALVALWLLGIRYHRAQRLRELSHRSIAEFGELKQQLTNRHVIVTHLADSIPKSFDPKFERQKLREISQTAEDSLSSIDPRKPSPDQIREFVCRERELLGVTRELVKSIKTENDLNRAHLVTSCLEGLDRANAQVGDHTSIYNTSALAYQNIKRASLLGQRKHKDEFTIVDIEA